MAKEMLQKIYPRIEKELSERGVKEFEVFHAREQQREWQVKNFVLDSALEAIEEGISLRVFRDQRMAFVYSTDLSASGLASLCQAAVEILPHVDPDPDFGLPEPQSLKGDLQLEDFDASLETIPTSRKLELAITLEKCAKAVDPRVRTVRSASYDEKVFFWALKNSRGVECSHAKTQCSVGVMAVAEENGEAESAYEFDIATTIEPMDPEKIGRKAAERALSYLGAITPETQKIPVLLDPLVACEVLEVLLSSFQGDEVLKNRSFLKDKIGQKLYSSRVNLIDDSERKGGLSSWPFDGEGLPSRKLSLVKAGVLENFLFDSYYGRKFQRGSNGSSVRHGIKKPPSISHSNLILEAGDATEAQLLADIGTGLLVTETIGMHAANPITGDFSVGAQGFLIEKGQVGQPVKKMTIAGNLHQMMADVRRVGTEHRFLVNIAAPMLAIQEITVGGE